MKKRLDAAARYVRKHAEKFIFAVSVTVVGAIVVAFLGFGSDGGSSTTTINNNPAPKKQPNYGASTGVKFTVRNDLREGVWALSSPVMKRFSNQDERPPNADRWLANGVGVEVECAVPGTDYNVTINGETMQWHFFARADEGFYAPMAGFAETVHDGPQGLVHCEG